MSGLAITRGFNFYLYTFKSLLIATREYAIIVLDCSSLFVVTAFTTYPRVVFTINSHHQIVFVYIIKPTSTLITTVNIGSSRNFSL